MGLKRRQWEGPVGLGLIASFIVTGMPTLLFATVLRLGIGHVLLVAITASGLSVSLSGVCRGNLINRVQSTVGLLFFSLVIVLLYLRGHG